MAKRPTVFPTPRRMCSIKLCYLIASSVRSLRVPVLRYPHVVTGLRHIGARSYERLFPGGPQPAACLLRSGTVLPPRMR
jgi:hypothetical protein